MIPHLFREYQNGKIEELCVVTMLSETDETEDLHQIGQLAPIKSNVVFKLMTVGPVPPEKQIGLSYFVQRPEKENEYVYILGDSKDLGDNIYETKVLLSKNAA